MKKVNDPNDYQLKIKRKDAILSGKVPDCVPVVSAAGNWVYSYAQIKVKETMHNSDLHTKALYKYLDEIYTDIIPLAGDGAALTLIEVLKPDVPEFIIAEDGYSLQHQEVATMLETEYIEFSKDPNKFIKNEIIPRKYPILAKPYPENFEYLKIAYKEAMNFLSNSINAIKYANEVIGIPTLAGSALIMPADIIFDYLRGFKGTLTDVRRHPEELEQAINAYTEVVIKSAFATVKKGDILFSPLHMATYLNPKQFERFYWPQFNKILKMAQSKGCKILAYFENNWSPFYEFLQDAPDNTLIGMMEYDDLKVTKKVLGKKMTILGGMPLEKLRFSKKEEAMDYTKEILDICAPGGGFGWMTDKVWVSPDDINVETYKACVDVVRTYGKY